MRFFFGVFTGFLLSTAPKLLVETVPRHLLDYGFGASTPIFGFVNVMILTAIGELNGSHANERTNGYVWYIIYLFPVPFCIISLIL